MAPLDAKAESKAEAGGDPYLEAWLSISRSMEEGVSWSGHERNVGWLNAGDGTFVEASGPMGFDQIEDGRVVCKTDWDRDGDIDLWLRSRNGVTLRYLENQSNPESFMEISDLGTRTSISVRLPSSSPVSALSSAVEIGARRLAAAMTDGYLSAPSRRITAVAPKGKRLSLYGEGLTHFDLVGPGPQRLSFEEGTFEDRTASFEARPPLEGSGALEQTELPKRTVLRLSLIHI